MSVQLPPASLETAIEQIDRIHKHVDLTHKHVRVILAVVLGTAFIIMVSGAQSRNGFSVWVTYGGWFLAFSFVGVVAEIVYIRPKRGRRST